MILQTVELNKETFITQEVNRLTEKYGKSYLTYKEIMEIMGIGRDSAKAMLRSNQFQVIHIGNRRMVSVIAFVTWQINNSFGG